MNGTVIVYIAKNSPSGLESPPLFDINIISLANTITTLPRHGYLLEVTNGVMLVNSRYYLANVSFSPRTI